MKTMKNKHFSFVLMTLMIVAMTLGALTVGATAPTDNNGTIVASSDGSEGEAAVAKVGDKEYATIDEAIAATQAGDTVVIIGAVADKEVVVGKDLTITGEGEVTLTNVSINATAGKLTVSNLTFTGKSWINAGGCDELVVDNVTANVSPSNNSYTNSRSAFIGLGRSESKQLKLTVTDCDIVVPSGTDAVLGWAAVTEVTISGNTFGSETSYQNSGDIVKFMAIADGAVLNITNNTSYSNYNGFVFAQNTTRENSYAVYVSGNTFHGGADHLWIEISGGDTVHAKVETTSDNTVNGNAFTAADIKYHSGVIKTWDGYAGVDVTKDSEGKLTGGSFLLAPSANTLADGFESKQNADGTYGVVFVPSYVAEVNGVQYKDLQEAIKAAAPSGTVELLCDVTVDKWIMISETLTIGDGTVITLDMSGLTIDGNGHTLTVKEVESAGNGNHLFYDGDYSIYDLTINMGDTVNGLGITSGTIKNVTFIGGHSTSGGAAIFVSDGLITGVHARNVTIEGCTFKNNGGAICFETAQNGLVVNKNTFEINSGANVILMRGTEKFTNNTVVSGRTVNVVSGSPVVSGNNFGDVRLKVYNEATATISNNTINNLVFNDGTVAKATFSGNTLSESAEAALEAVTQKQLVGSGTAADPFLIGNVEELLWFQAKVDEQAADGSTQFAGKYFKLTADIDLAGINWNPIGSKTGDHASFKGVFDGDGHTIYNLYIEQAGEGLGLFAYTSGNAVIKNLNLVNVTVKSTNNSSYVGGLIGNAYASTKIENVHISGDVYISGRGYIGGIAGHGYVKMDNVSVKANEGGLITSTFWCAGGILGYGGEGSTNIKNAHVEGLTITSAAGGLGAIVGKAEDNYGTQPISGSNLSAKNVVIKTYVGGYGTAYEDYAIGYLYGGSDISKLTGDLSVENVTVTTASGKPATVVDAVASIGNTPYFSLQAAIDAVQDDETIVLLRDITITINDVTYNDGTYIDGVRYTGDKSFTIDFGGYTVTDDGCVNDYLIYLNNKGTKANEITFKNGTLVSKNGCWSTVCVNSSASTYATVLNLNGMKITNSNDATYSGNPVVRARDMATVNVNSDTVITSDGASYGITANVSTAVVNINSGATVIQQNSGTTGGNSVFAAVGGKGNINIFAGATITSDRYGIHTMTTGTPEVNIYGGTITAPVALKASTNGGVGELATINVTGGTINGELETYTNNGKIVVSGGNFTVDPTDYLKEGYIATGSNGAFAIATAAAKIGNTSYATLEEAFKAATNGCTIEILADVVIDGKWDCRDYATNGSHSQFNESVTINGNGHTIKFTGTINDSNWNTVFRFEENATVTNLTIDISEATGAQRVITARKSLTVDGLTIIGSAKYGIIFGEGAGAADLAAAEIVIQKSTLTGTRRAISDNEGGKDVKSVVITDNTLNGNVCVSASTSIVFTDNTATGDVDLRSYAADNVLSVMAKKNTLTEGKKNYISAKYIEAQEEFTAEYPTIEVGSIDAFKQALENAAYGATIKLLDNINLSEENIETLVLNKGITLDLNGKTLTVGYLVAFNGNHVIDNTRGTGLLIVGKDKIMLSADNANMAVWTETTAGNGYKFAEVKMQFTGLTYEDTGFSFGWRPSFTNKGEVGINNQVLVDETLMAKSGLQFIVRVTWTEQGQVMYQDLVYTSKYIAERYSKSELLTISVSGFSSNHSDIKAMIIVKSDSGVEASGTVVSEFVVSSKK